MKKSVINLIFILIFQSGLFSQSTNHGNSNLNSGLGNLPMLENVETRSISAENPTGEKGKGGMAVPDVNNPDLPNSVNAKNLGQGWKVNPCIRSSSGETTTLMDVDGPGVIQHIWMTTGNSFAGHGRACILRFYWDNEKEPSVEVPMTDFFAVGHDIVAMVNSLPVTVTPEASLNCYWPMPFRKHVKITVTNDGNKEISLFYQIDYALTKVPDNAAYFHAQWRRAVTDPKNPVYTILDNVRGSGKYIGTFLAFTQLHSGWSGEGEVKFFIDGDQKFPTICGTGMEDYFGSSYGFPGMRTYSTSYCGSVLDNTKNSEGSPIKWSYYRWHIMDPVYFHRDLKVTIQALGWYPGGGKPGGFRPMDDDFASVAYWYQTEPHNPFPKLPEVSERWPR